MEHSAHDLNSDAFRKMNHFEQLPVIDDDGVLLSGSGVILIYLAKKSGKLISKDAAGEARVVRWYFAATNLVEIPLMTILILGWVKDEGCCKYREFLVGWPFIHYNQ